MRVVFVAILISAALHLGTTLAGPSKRQDDDDDDDDYKLPSINYAQTGKIEQIGRTGVTAMHAVLLNERKILIFDRAEDNEAHFDSGQAAWSTEYDIELNQYRALHMQTNSFCSAGGFLGNGTFVSTGGGQRTGRTYKALEGFQSVRLYGPCTDDSCAWTEHPTGQMGDNRWYPTMEQLPDGSLFIIGGSNKPVQYNSETFNTPTYEFWPSRGNATYMSFLNETLENNLYPFVHVLPSGKLWIFANRRSIIFDYTTNTIVRELPQIPGNPRSYPLTGTSVLLPLRPENDYHAEVLVCGGSEGTKRKLQGHADNTCARLDLDAEDPVWETDTFVFPRLMPDGVLLPDGTILFINGCQKGIAGFNRGREPILEPVIYDPRKPLGKRWTQGLAKSDIPRMYHSVALLIPDGRVWIAGSNPNQPANASAIPFPTEFRVEYFSPPYLFNVDNTPASKPLVSSVPLTIRYGQSFTINVNLLGTAAGLNLQSPLDQEPALGKDAMAVLINPGFVTHSLHMSQRLVELVSELNEDCNVMTIKAPPNANIFPPGPAWLYVVNRGVPSVGVRVMVEKNDEQ